MSTLPLFDWKMRLFSSPVYRETWHSVIGKDIAKKVKLDDGVP